MKKRILALLLLLALACGIGAGCSANPDAGEKKAAQTPAATDKLRDTRLIKDMLGRELRVPLKIKSIAAGPGCARILSYAGAAERIKGISAEESSFQPCCPYLLINGESFTGLSIISKKGELQSRELKALKPDVLLLQNISAQEADGFQTELGIPVFVLQTGSGTEVFDPKVYEAILSASLLCGTQLHAELAVTAIKCYEADLLERSAGIPEDKRPVVYFGGLSREGVQGIEQSFSGFQPFMSLNTENPADKSGVTGQLSFDKSRLSALDPEFIFLDPDSESYIRKDFRSDPDFYRGLRAFNTGNVYLLPPYDEPEINIGLAITEAYYIGSLIYPQQFKDLRFRSKADEIFVSLLGKPCLSLLSENGSFGPLEPLLFPLPAE